MHPVLFKIGPITIYSYGVMLATAVLVCTYLLSLDAKRSNISQDTAYDLVFWCLVGGFIGARIFYIFLEWPYYSANPLAIPMIWEGGLAWQGGFIGGILSGVWFVRRHKLFIRPTLDLVAPYIALGQSIGRIGCFLKGCCYGKPVSWGPYYPVHHARLYPTQLFECAMLFVIFLVLKKAQSKPHMAGFIFVLYLWLAAVERFVVEFFRGDTVPTGTPLSLAQYVAIGVFISGLVLLKVFKKNEANAYRRPGA
ncbi:MAG: prolipoprotein diacylglyceryl transferase [Candidatus Omnitrophica bacterium]|nr:prolipoprotein diacylglyceryl transferase [Candidatus Omnitrophota bacterium]MDE2230807.1 prolipoprotein diacylglyceryl transferase [Candidatus Omnitrophota bacterium]